MRWRLVALVSLGVNLLAAIWLFSLRSYTRDLVAREAALALPAPAPVMTNVIVRRQFFTWQEIESPDYPTFINNLREIGCPEQTVRDIIIADVNALFSRRRATELVTPEQQWWRTEPDTNVVQLALDKARSLEEERLDLLAELLGPDWEAGDMANVPRPSRPGVVLDGPVLGALSLETKQLLQDINARSEDRLQEYLEAQTKARRSPDPLVLAEFRQQIRDELASVLSPAQLEEYLLRFSQNAGSLRAEFGQLRFFNPTADEFRNVFRAVDSFDTQMLALTGNEPNVVQQRRALEEARENAIRVALGPRRYEDYRLLQDPLYRDAVAAAQQAGTPEAARTLYQISLAAAAQQAGITNDATLTAAQREVALKQLELEQLTANTLATGQEPTPPMPPMPPAVPRRLYRVHPGDSLAVIALIYGVPARAIEQLNPHINFSRLRPGDTVNIPPRAMVPPSAP